jgi:hypothetical protein
MENWRDKELDSVMEVWLAMKMKILLESKKEAID